MIVRAVIRKNEFWNSVLLMSISEKASDLDGIDEAAVLMATKLNKQVLGRSGLMTEDILEAGSNDVVIAVKARTLGCAQNAIGKIENMLSTEQKRESGTYFPKTFSAAHAMMPDANIVVISVPGAFAKREALKALENGLHVFLFSSEVPVEDELELKQLGTKKGLLVMGPDCGTAIIRGVVLGFGNVLSGGPIGIVAASGTGIQQVSTIIHRMGSGISHAIGTGGRDLSQEIGGIATLNGIEYLERDEKTKVILLISKMPSQQALQKVIAVANRCQKAIIINIIGSEWARIQETKLIPATTLEDAAYKAVASAKGCTLEVGMFTLSKEKILAIANRERGLLSHTQIYIRGLFSGGTICSESLAMLRDLVGVVYSNTPITHGSKLANAHKSKNHTCVDMGAEEFVMGRPHPMIDLTLRKERILRESRDPTTGAILLDIVLGYGAHPDPAGVLACVIRQAKKEAEMDGRYMPVVASVVGTELDSQNLTEQEEKLKDAGVIVLPSSTQATRMAALIVSQREVQSKLFQGEGE